jgi:hypothetical protein
LRGKWIEREILSSWRSCRLFVIGVGSSLSKVTIDGAKLALLCFLFILLDPNLVIVIPPVAVTQLACVNSATPITTAQ